MGFRRKRISSTKLYVKALIDGRLITQSESHHLSSPEYTFDPNISAQVRLIHYPSTMTLQILQSSLIGKLSWGFLSWVFNILLFSISWYSVCLGGTLLGSCDINLSNGNTFSDKIIEFSGNQIKHTQYIEETRDRKYEGSIVVSCSWLQDINVRDTDIRIEGVSVSL